MAEHTRRPSGRTTTHLRVPKSMHEQLRARAAAEGRTIAELLADVLARDAKRTREHQPA